MDDMTTFQYLSIILSFISIIFVILNFSFGRKKDSTESVASMIAKAKEEGKQEQNILNAISNLSDKVDEIFKNQFTKEQFKEAEKNFVTREEFADVVARSKSNTHRLDELEGVKHD